MWGHVQPGFEAASQDMVSTRVCHRATSVVRPHGPDIHVAPRRRHRERRDDAGPVSSTQSAAGAPAPDGDGRRGVVHSALFVAACPSCAKMIN